MVTPYTLSALRYVTSIDAWWSSLSVSERRPYWSPGELEASLSTPMRALAAALCLGGWHRVVRRLDGRMVTLWIPPAPWGTDPRRRPVGRPSINVKKLAKFVVGGGSRPGYSRER